MKFFIYLEKRESPEIPKLYQKANPFEKDINRPISILSIISKLLIIFHMSC